MKVGCSCRFEDSGAFSSSSKGLSGPFRPRPLHGRYIQRGDELVHKLGTKKVYTT